MALTLEVVRQKAIAVKREDTVVAASWFGPWVQRPFVYPFLAPGDHEVICLGHPEDPIGHSHHRGIWIGHHDVGGIDFWSEAPSTGRIVQEDVAEIVASGDAVGALLVCSWRKADDTALLAERRRLTFVDLGGGELALDIDTVISAVDRPVVLGKTNFGILGIRVARTMRVREGLGGRIENSNEAEDEAGCFGQHAEWCDYSGPVPAAAAVERPSDEKPAGGADGAARAKAPRRNGLAAALVGIACFDHPENSPAGTLWHVRDDGWMGPGLTRDEARTLAPGQPLRVRYRILAHAGRAPQAQIGERYRVWRAEVTGTSREGESPGTPKNR
jgi:hypothetical protein